jgi:hypothetical protein
MKISIITPTCERGRHLQGAYQLIQQQTCTDWEWLIYDTSLHPSHFSDPRVIYIHDQESLSIGQKRNRLKQKATGEIIVHFDDDDYYAPTYLEMVAQRLEKVSFFTIHSWFSYDVKTAQFYYWDTTQLGEVHYHTNAISGSRIREVDLSACLAQQKMGLHTQEKQGYGFSFAYTQEVAQACFFPDLDLGEDRYFLETVKERAFSLSTLADQQGITIHVIHDSNTSSEFPQYRIPQFLVEPLFPNFFPYIKRVHEN